MGMINDVGSGIIFVLLFFVDEVGQDYWFFVVLLGFDVVVVFNGSVLLDYVVVVEYFFYQVFVEWLFFGVMDFGVFEMCGVSGCGVFFFDDFELGGLGVWVFGGLVFWLGDLVV